MDCRNFGFRIYLKHEDGTRSGCKDMCMDSCDKGHWDLIEKENLI